MTYGPFAKKITELREKKGLAKKGISGVSASLMQKIENEGYIPKGPKLAKLAEALGGAFEEFKKLAAVQKAQAAQTHESQESDPSHVPLKVPAKPQASATKSKCPIVSPAMQSKTAAPHKKAHGDDCIVEQKPHIGHSAAGLKNSGKPAIAKTKNERAKFKAASQKNFKQVSTGKSKARVALKAEKYNRKIFSQQLRQEINDWFAKATRNSAKAVSYAGLCKLTDQVQGRFIKNTGVCPPGVQGACVLARGYLNPDSIERWKLIYRGIGLLISTAGGVAILFGIITAFGIGLGLWASLWAAIAGSTGPVTGGASALGGLAAVGFGIYAAVCLETPQSLSAKAHDAIIKAVDSWADEAQAKKQDREAKAAIKAKSKKTKSSSVSHPIGKDDSDLLKSITDFIAEGSKKISDVDISQLKFW